MLEQADEVQEAMGRSYGMPDIDEDELAAELDALGDEIALDEDTSYLDDAIKAPNAPDKEPGSSSVRNKVIIQIYIYFLLILSYICLFIQFTFRMVCWWMSLDYLKFQLVNSLMLSLTHK